MPAAKLRPVLPRTTTRPPVMYSQPWSPTPSTTATAPEFRTQNRSPTTPRMKHLARGRAVADHVAGDDVLLGGERRRRVGPQGQPPTGQALAEVVVGVADQPQRDALRHERAEALAGRAGERDVDRVVGQALAAVRFGSARTQHGADGAVDVADRQVQTDPVADCAARPRPAGSCVLSSALSRPWSCSLGPLARPSSGTSGDPEDRREVEPADFQCWAAESTSRARRPGRSPRRSSRKPSSARISRTSSATNLMKLTTYSGRP
jgi:hypothetical protein